MKKPALTRYWIGRFVLPLVVALAFSGTSFAQDASKEEQDVTEDQIERFKDIKKAARKEKVSEVAEQDATGNDPRVFANKWMPFYRQTELENGLTQQDLTAFGTMAFSPTVGMFYELPVAQYRDFSDIPGTPAGTDAIGIGDVSIKFLYRPRALDFHYGKDGKKSGSVLFGTDMVLPTGTTDDGLTGNSLLFAPIVAIVYMQPLTKPGKWWGAIFVMPEFQPVYDFETEDFSLWIGLEIGKMFAPGRIGYIKPGWGTDNSEGTDRDSTFEVGFRWFF
jgi:hypothetical protein